MGDTMQPAWESTRAFPDGGKTEGDRKVLECGRGDEDALHYRAF